MKWIYAVFLLLLAACGSSGEGGHNNHGYGYSYDAITESGLRVRYPPAPTTYTPDYFPPSFFETVYREVMECAGLNYPGPLVVMVAPPLYFEGDSVSGITYHDTGTIVITRTSIMRHEFVHYLLLMNGFPNDRNKNHDSPLFDACGS